ncbi:hypothetical protein PHLGIDRAFT_424347 [Phlebiopsis gigantea 11061_1 CR5-6]|uniref:Uncharacterized protein n=1 Tax=Phlebiopsis gigantea (strain 11061_1 CR5-6) TaxID=745531 RepID=A0A0C3RYS7_PHLG1|nr:hypothetical protein PHLGIDRAFT_424347 [Phlebiopsis gigantea 11061_1 CR5-6]
MMAHQTHVMSSQRPAYRAHRRACLSTTMAAVDVYTLLSLPASKAFSAFRTSDFPVDEAPRSASPPRKIARLAVDSDSASASRSRGAAAAAGPPAEGPASLVLRLQGNPSKAGLGVRSRF